jgi:hypothetical protein
MRDSGFGGIEIAIAIMEECLDWFTLWFQQDSTGDELNEVQRNSMLATKVHRKNDNFEFNGTPTMED